MHSLMLKLILVGIMFFVTLLTGLAPIRLLKFLRRKAALAETSRKQRFVSLFLCMLTCFSGGVFLATCFLHLLPELNEHLLEMKIAHNYEWDYPIAELFSCVGFFLLFFFEEMVIVVFPSIAHNHSHSSHHHTTKTISSSNTQNIIITTQNNGGSDEESSCSTALAEPERCEAHCEQIKENPPIFIKRRPHAHSHGIRSLGFVLAISFHSVVEGIALGVQSENSQVWAIFFSLMIHKLIVAFSVGLQLARTHAHAIRWVCLSILLFAGMTPLGACFGAFVQNAQMEPSFRDWLILIFQGIAVGTFIYVTFFEVLIHERDNEHPNLLKLLFMIIGFSIIGLFRLAHSHSHEHHHSGGGGGHEHVVDKNELSF